jgi:hypothetical protein
MNAAASTAAATITPRMVPCLSGRMFISLRSLYQNLAFVNDLEVRLRPLFTSRVGFAAIAGASNRAMSCGSRGCSVYSITIAADPVLMESDGMDLLHLSAVEMFPRSGGIQ